MTITSLTQLAAGAVQQSIGKSNSRLAASIANIASGNRLARASADVAALSAATALQTEVNSLRAASLNISQASSLLQVADGGLGQIGSILDRMQALSVQANSGALSDSGRKGLNAEFQALSEEINRLSGNTNFNGINLLDGSLSNGGQISTSTQAGEKASGSISFLANTAAGNTVVLNGQTLVAGTDFAIGASTQSTVSNLANALNNDARFSGFNFTANGATLEIKANAAGTAGNQFTINDAGSTANFFTSGDALSGAGVFSLQGGTDAGLSAGDTSVSGIIGNNLLTGLSNSNATSLLTFSGASDIQAGDSIDIDNGEGGVTSFTFVSGTPASNTEIQIGSNLQETLQNAATTMENYAGTGDFGTRQLDFTVSGNSLVIASERPGNALDANGNPLDIALNTTGGSISATQLNNGSTGGVNVNNVTSAGFTGTIQGFNAAFTGNDQVQLSIRIGNDTFRATVSDTTPASDTVVTFTSETGGSFDVTLAAGRGESITTQADANDFANRLDAAFSTLKFSQQREVTSFNPSGRLVGASLEIQAGNLSNLNISNINVSAGGGASSVEFVINGQTFRSDNLGSSIGANERVILRADNGDSLTFTNGDNIINLASSADASTFATNLNKALSLGDGDGLAFQIGSSSDGVVNLGIGDVSAKALFGGQNLNLLSLEGAQAAFAAIGQAIDSITAERAGVGAFQQALGYAGNAVDVAIQNQEAARATLQDTDLASESTLMALLKAQRDAGITTLAQTNKMSANMLKLIG